MHGRVDCVISATGKHNNESQWGSKSESRHPVKFSHPGVAFRAWPHIVSKHFIFTNVAPAMYDGSVRRARKVATESLQFCFCPAFAELLESLCRRSDSTSGLAHRDRRSHPRIREGASLPCQRILTMDSGKALRSVDLARALFREAIAVTLNAGISRPESTNMKTSRRTNSQCLCSRKAGPAKAHGAFHRQAAERRSLGHGTGRIRRARGEYAALYPKSWFAYDPHSLASSSRWSSSRPSCRTTTRRPAIRSRSTTGTRRIPSDKPVTVSLLFSWTNMVGWFRDTTSGFSCAFEHSGQKPYVSEVRRAIGTGAPCRALSLTACAPAPCRDEWDGQFAIAAESFARASKSPT